ncbi:alpha/beta hydrolase [Actinomadura fulvescens]|uniref:Alpha/beta hydrolase n=2 Tax=Actinomadura fulvescens TaxID=46160 RepID=A0ABN3PHU2_9ACTN
MNPSRSFITVASLAIAASTAVPVAAPAGTAVAGTAVAATAAAGTAPKIEWKACRAFSEAALKQMFAAGQIAEFKALWARTECGTVSVPLDYGAPSGRKISIAVTRLKATDQARRLGSLALNPGGPGGSGYLMPVTYVMLHRNGNGEKLNQRYDLIGFDPRGVGYSTKVDCPDPGQAPDPGPSPITKVEAKQVYDRTVKANQACGNHDPAFLRQLTTANVARDLDQIRQGLRQRTLSFLGISWGTWLGAIYRSLFPASVQRMWLDSTAIPEFRLDTFEAGRAKATDRNFSRLAAWMAERNATYGFGSTAAQVERSLARMRVAFNAHPKTFTDLPDWVFDGVFIALASSTTSRDWPLAAAVLRELRQAQSGANAPPLIKKAFSPPPGDGGTPPSDLPEEFNPTMHQAVFCNEDTGPRDFDSAWAAYQKRLRRYPVTGEASGFINNCAGWPHPAQAVKLRRNNASLVMSGHRYEVPSPYEWTRQMQASIGGSVLTVGDDIHGSTAGEDTDCAPRIAAYFFTGRPDNGRCQGVPLPTSTEVPPLTVTDLARSLAQHTSKQNPYASNAPTRGVHS